ncbi:hypothetical protein [Sorangium cellulosum]|uniref:hypothetical protein n=1 Tax=Sorangium cellulosum TaxID=56 RepID=UPI00133142AB|nr:hypothetical protein [Sorangium cellulosum]
MPEGRRRFSILVVSELVVSEAKIESNKPVRRIALLGLKPAGVVGIPIGMLVGLPEITSGGSVVFPPWRWCPRVGALFIEDFCDLDEAFVSIPGLDFL